MKYLLLLCTLLLLSSCLSERASPSAAQPAPSAPVSSYTESAGESEAPIEIPAYMPAKALTAEETVEAFFEQQYQAYAEMEYIDLSGIVDTAQARNNNALIWLQTLIQRRKLIRQQGYCYVETGIYPYTVTFEEAEDGREGFWQQRGIMGSSSSGSAEMVMLHFTITGEKGRAYPPMMALNAQHTVALAKLGGVWKIVFHYYPGSVRRFFQNGSLRLPDEEEMLADLAAEFAAYDDPAPPALPQNAEPYSGNRASAYAQNYTETPNPEFYDIGDWMGNCANFISQCVWYGFSGSADKPSIAGYENMTDDWFAGSGRGSPAWENVGYFWDYATKARSAAGTGLHGVELTGVSQLETGDVIQVRTGRSRHEEEDAEAGEGELEYNHSLVVVDDKTLLLAQNSPDCFLYYSDLVNVNSRFYRPVYLVE